MAATVERLDERLREAESDTQSANERLMSHEAICAERYGTINANIAAINRTVTMAAVTLITGMAAILVRLLFFTVP